MLFKAKSSVLLLLVACFAFGWFALSTSKLKAYKRAMPEPTLEVEFSPIVQLFMAGGDRYLAANLGAMRAIMLPVQQINTENAALLALVHRNVATFNPYHEDNYYIAESVLPWYGQVSAANEVLLIAEANRHSDILPGFFLGFNAMYFEKDYTRAGKFYFQTAQRAPAGPQRDSMLALSATFYEKGDDPDFAISVIQRMQAGSQNSRLKEHLQIRLIRLEMLKFLRAAAQRYVKQFHRPLESLDVLVSSGVVTALPQDPLGVGFAVKDGVPIIKLKSAGR